MYTTKQLLEKFEQYLKDQTFQQEPTALYAPANYIMAMGGKRMRPLLTLLSCQLFKGDISKALPAALSVELFHNFSLVHDDIMDQAEVRRGFPAVHTKYGLNNAILTGDVMLIYAYDFLQKSPNKSAISDMVNTLSKVAIKVCEGQQYDVDFENRDDVSLEEYIKMIELKTAVLLAGSLRLGALAGNAPTKDQDHLAEFGRLTGIAFQLQDDYLDTFGDPEKFGKRPGGDIIQNKKTALYIQALQQAPAELRQQLLDFYQQRPDDPTMKVQFVTKAFEQLGIPAFIKQLKENYQQQAFAHLEQVQAPADAKQLLAALASSLLIREM